MMVGKISEKNTIKGLSLTKRRNFIKHFYNCNKASAFNKIWVDKNNQLLSANNVRIFGKHH